MSSNPQNLRTLLAVPSEAILSAHKMIFFFLIIVIILQPDKPSDHTDHI